MHLELSFYQRNLAHLHYISTSMSELKIEEREHYQIPWQIWWRRRVRVEESPCESKHGEGGPREELELSLAAPAAAGKSL